MNFNFFPLFALKVDCSDQMYIHGTHFRQIITIYNEYKRAIGNFFIVGVKLIVELHTNIKIRHLFGIIFGSDEI